MENGTVESVVSKRHENRTEAPANVLQYAQTDPLIRISGTAAHHGKRRAATPILSKTRKKRRTDKSPCRKRKTGPVVKTKTEKKKKTMKTSG